MTRPVDILFPHANRVARIAQRVCAKPPIGCGKPVGEFRDELSEREYAISGFCQQCQDNIFGA